MQVQTEQSTSLAPGAELVRRAQDAFGIRLTQIIAAGRRPSATTDSAFAALANDCKAETRLHVALDIAAQLLALEALSTVQAWFVGKNPMLGDRAPDLVIAEDPDAVRRAAHHFLANG